MSAAVQAITKLLTRSNEEHRLFSRTSGAAFVSSGMTEVDNLLGGGFVRGSMTEILPVRQGYGELRLILGAVARLGRACWILSGSADVEPYAPALTQAGIDISEQLFAVPASPEEAFWCAEHAAASGETDAVVAWLTPLTREKDSAAMRRLHLAAARTDTTVFVFRPYVMSCVASPAEMRLQLIPGTHSDRITLRAVKEGLFFPQIRSVELDVSALTGYPPLRMPMPYAESQSVSPASALGMIL